MLLGLCTMFLYGAIRLGHGRPDRIGFLSIGAGVLDGALYRDPLVNTYPPPFSVLMAPASALERAVGNRPVRWLWGGLQLCSLVFATVAFSQAMRIRLTTGRVALAWLCLWRDIVGDLNKENVTLFLLALEAAALRSLAQGSPGRSGALLGVGSAIKIWPGFALLGVAASRPIRDVVRAAAGAVAGAAALFALTLVVLGPARLLEALAFWFGEVLPRAGDASIFNQSLKALLLRLSGGAPWAGPVAMGLAVAGLAALVLLLRARRLEGRAGAALDGAFATAAGMLVLPFVWFHYFAVLLPIVLWILAVESRLAPARRRLVLGLLVAGVVVGSFLDIDVVGRAGWQGAAFMGNALVGALLVMAAGLVARLGHDAPPTDD